MRKRAVLLGIVSLFVLLIFAPSSWAGSRHERRMERLKASENQLPSPEELQKAEEVQIQADYDRVWDITVQALKARSLIIESANKDIGQIKTEFQITVPKKPKQRGMRYIIDLRQISDAGTGLRVAAMEQMRVYRFQAEPWKVPKYNAEASDSLTQAIVQAVAQ